MCVHCGSMCVPHWGKNTSNSRKQLALSENQVGIFSDLQSMVGLCGFTVTTNLLSV